MSHGISLTSDSVLLARARELLSQGSADSVSLISYVCQLPSPPMAVAEHLADVLLGDAGGFRRDELRRWQLGEHVHPATIGTVETEPALQTLSYVVVDVETTGTRPTGGDRITEIAAVMVRNGEIGEVYETLVNPERPIPAFITTLTNITQEMVADSPRFFEVAPRVVDVLGQGIFTAHNAPFDWRFVASELSRATGGRMNGRRLCTVRLSRLLLPHLPRRSLDNVAHHFGIDIESRHRAAGDAVATARELLRLLQAEGDRGVETWSALEKFLSPRGRSPRAKRHATPRWMDRDSSA